MKDQPKPASGEHQPWCQAITSARGVGPFPCDCKPANDVLELHIAAAKLAGADGVQVKPASSEWTVEWLDSMGIDGEKQRKLLCQWHNAALAAATARELHSYDVAKLCRDELAAEREKVKNWEETAAMYARNWEDAKQQLAAEREKLIQHGHEIRELRQQLAADRVNLKEALHLLAMSRFDAGDDESVNRETTLLAKVKP